MMRGILRESIRDMSREEWLERRRLSLGGSDAAAIVGLSRWATPYTVWADKTGRLPEREDTEAMRTGRDLEQYVAERFCEATGKKVRRVRAMLYNDLYPWAHADIDREVVGENAGLECKTTSTLDLRQFETGEFPEQYYAQCVHYLAVTGCARWYLAILVLGRGFFLYTLERDEHEIEALMEAERTFWEAHVVPDKPPTPDGTAATTAAISSVFSHSFDDERRIDQHDLILREYAALRAQKKELEGRMDEIENIVKADMEDASFGVGSAFKVTWKSQERKTFQIKAFEKDHPEIDLAPYYKISSVRPFKVAELKTKGE